MILPLLLSISARLSERTYPSIFQAWSPAEHLEETKDQTVARHDLIFQGAEAYGLKWSGAYSGSALSFTPASIQKALEHRQVLLQLNPHLIFLMEVRYRDAGSTYFPENSRFWLRDQTGKRKLGWKEGNYFLLDFANSDLQKIIGAQCAAAIKTKVVDGCFFDWWSDETSERVQLIQEVRKAAGESALLMVNTNGKMPLKTGKLINGIFLEGFGAPFFKDWMTAKETLCKSKDNLKQPSFTALEAWGERNDPLRLRAVTTLSLTQSDGYLLYGDPNILPTVDHLHSWYPLWEKTLGKPTEEPCAPPHSNGTYSRNFEKGTVVFNPPENSVIQIRFGRKFIRASTGLRAKSHLLHPGDGDLFLK